MEAVNSLVVCVEFDDFLAVTLPRNKKHFARTLVVTSCCDIATQRVALENDCECFTTDSFYEHGAVFNKGLAIEKALDVLGRNGWLCLWDADIVMSQSIQFSKDPSCLYTALRRTLDDPTTFSDDLDWSTVPVTGLENEYPGYFQLFHDSAAGNKPWFEINWKHAGGYDSRFQCKFHNKLRRPPFYVLHLGPSVDKEEKFHLRIGENWCGRVTKRIDGVPLTDHKSRADVAASFKSARFRGSNVDSERL